MRTPRPSRQPHHRHGRRIHVSRKRGKRRERKVSKDSNFSATRSPITTATAHTSPANLTSGQTFSKTNPNARKKEAQVVLAPRMKYALTSKHWKKPASIRSSSSSKPATTDTIIYANHSNVSHKMYCQTSKRDTKYTPHKKQNASAPPSKKHTQKFHQLTNPNPHP